MAKLATVLILMVSSSALAQSVGDGPEISRSVGSEGGVVLFWPRVVPSSVRAETSALAGAVQSYLNELVAATVPSRAIDVRPEPERVCPLAGCDAMTVGVLIARHGGGCVLVALVSPPGQSAARLVPWVGNVTVNSESVPFREPPESHITISDFAACDEVVERLADAEHAIAAAIRTAAR